MTQRSHKESTTRSKPQPIPVRKKRRRRSTREELVTSLAWTGGVTGFALVVIVVYGILVARIPAENVVGQLVDWDWVLCTTCIFFLLVGVWNAIRFSHQTGRPTFGFQKRAQQKTVSVKNKAATADEQEYFKSLSTTYGLPRFSVPNLRETQVR